MPLPCTNLTLTWFKTEYQRCMSGALRSPSIKVTFMSYSPIPLPFAGTGEYMPHQLRLSRSASFPLKANQRKEMAAGWLLSVFSVIQPASATYCTPHLRLGCNHWQLVRQPSPKPTRVEEITQVGYYTFTASYPSSPHYFIKWRSL